MEIWTSKAWGLLKEEEQTALKLQFGVGKSSWEASEIMGRAHYKYLEIKKRGEKFFKLFQEHFDYYADELIPPSSKEILEADFIKYIEAIIVDRLTVSEAIAKADSNRLLVSEVRNGVILRNMALLRTSKELADKSLFNIIMDFDRWNNFRILPKEIQEPHAFTRRNKNRHKKLVHNLMSIHPVVMQDVCEKYTSLNTTTAGLWLVIPYKTTKKSWVVNVDKTDRVVEELSQMGMFLFARADDANRFLELMLSYQSPENKHPKEGQKFWNQFREILPRTYNYRQLEHIVADRRTLSEAIKRSSK